MQKAQPAIADIAPQENPSEFRSGWRLLLSALLGTGLGLPTLATYSIGIFAPQFAKQFGWSFASIFGGLSLTTLLLLLGGPVVGHFVDRHGPRKIAAVSLFALGCSYMSLALSTGSIVQYYLSWIAIAILGLGATYISFTEAVNQVFVRQRGLALGIVLSGSGLYGFAVKPLAGWLLTVTDWRGAITAIGLMPIVIGAPAVLWGFPKTRADAHSKKQPLDQPTSALSLKQVLRRRAFWMLVIAVLCVGFAGVGPVPNLENILRSAHIGAEERVKLSSLIGISIVAGHLLGGWLIDRIWAPLVGLIFMIGAAAGAWLLSKQMFGSHDAMIAIVLFGLGGGMGTGLMSFLVGRYFGIKSYGTIFGVVFGVIAVSAALGPSLVGYAYDRLGNYELILRVCSLSLVFAGFALLGMGRYPEPNKAPRES